MSADTPEWVKWNHLKNIFRGNIPSNPLAMYCKTSMSYKYNYAPLLYALDRYAGNAIIINCFADNLIICILLMCYY